MLTGRGEPMSSRKKASATSPPSPPHSKANSGQYSTGQFSFVRNRNESGLLAAHFYDAHGYCSYAATAATTFAACAFFTQAPGASARTVAVHYPCNRNDCFIVC